MTAPRILALLALAVSGCLAPLVTWPDEQDSDPPDSPTDSEPWEDPASDEDGDGYTVDQGDCDDEDPAIHPGVDSDGCDGVDNDCDGQTDEDFEGDEYEPNDSRGYYLGTMKSEAELLLFGYLHPDSDEDRFRFWVEDGT